MQNAGNDLGCESLGRYGEAERARPHGGEVEAATAVGIGCASRWRIEAGVGACLEESYMCAFIHRAVAIDNNAAYAAGWRVFCRGKFRCCRLRCRKI